MVPDNHSTPPRRPGRPVTPAPDGRDLEEELNVLREWLSKRPSIKPATVSKEAHLKGPTLGDMLRKARRPQAATLDRIYKALHPYGFIYRTNATK